MVIGGSLPIPNIVELNLVIKHRLTGRVLTGSVLTGSVLTGSVLTGSVLTGSVLTGSVLTGSVLTGSVLTGSVLTGSVLTGQCVDSIFYCYVSDPTGLSEHRCVHVLTSPRRLEVQNTLPYKVPLRVSSFTVPRDISVGQVL